MERPKLLLTLAHLREIETHLERAYPAEGCGLLVGHTAVDGALTVESVVTLDNVSKQSSRYFELDPKDILRVQRQADDNRMSIIGIVHSHPDCAPIPSVTDIRHAANWPSTVWLIQRVQEHKVVDRPRVWWMGHDGFSEIPLELVES